MADRPLWPNFDPLLIPVAIFDGNQTWLFRHPSPPPGYKPIAGNNARVLPGRDPAITANTSDKIAGVPTATLLRANYPDVTRQAAMLMHEAFHVFQRAHHPDWSANEAELFLYPVNNAEVLQARRLESESLRRALDASAGESRCWARAALDWRSDRFGKLTAGAAEYERRTELNEGLAQYVEDRAAGKVRANLLPSSEFPIDAVRSRSYSIGQAIGILLDRFNPPPDALTPGSARFFGDWHEELDSGSTKFLDQVLARRLAGVNPCQFDPAEKQDALRRAQADVSHLQQTRQDLLRDFHNQPGWRVVIESSAGKLGMQGFDPLNVTLVGNGLIVHSRFLKAGGEGASVEILGARALTEAAGAHPAFSGFRRITIAGFTQPPTINQAASGGVTIAAPGLKAEFAKASVVVDDAAKQISISF